MPAPRAPSPGPFPHVKYRGDSDGTGFKVSSWRPRGFVTSVQCIVKCMARGKHCGAFGVLVEVQGQTRHQESACITWRRDLDPGGCSGKHPGGREIGISSQGPLCVDTEML